MNKILLLTVVLLLCVGCHPYRTFYKETSRVGAQQHDKTVYRIKLHTTDTFDAIDFSVLQHLKSLDLTGLHTQDMEYVLDKIPQPELLSVLILDSVQGQTIPTGIETFVNLKQLSLNANPSLDFEEIFRNLKTLPLEFLNVQHNELTALPENLKDLTTLQDLNLSHNMISDSNSFNYLQDLTQLNALWLTDNQLTSLPITITTLSQLRNLYLEYNLLTTFPDEIINMERLWVLHAGHNRFKELPSVLTEMQGLLLVHINNNSISTIPEEFTTNELTMLGLVMDNNKLSENDKLLWRKRFRKFFLLSL